MMLVEIEGSIMFHTVHHQLVKVVVVVVVSVPCCFAKACVEWQSFWFKGSAAQAVALVQLVIACCQNAPQLHYAYYASKQLLCVDFGASLRFGGLSRSLGQGVPAPESATPTQTSGLLVGDYSD